MKKMLITFLLFVFTLSAFSQIFEKTKKEGEKVEKARTRLKKRFNISTIDYICDYYCYKEENIDSLSTFLDNLIKNYPNHTELYLYRANYLYREHDFSNKVSYNKLKIKYLNAALEIDTSNRNTIYSLAETYYKDFIYPREKEKYFFDDDDSTFLNLKREKIIKKSAFEHAADSALKYFYKLWNVDSEIKDVIYFPIRQLECYLECREQSPIKEDIMLNSYCYFPSWYFANLSENWEHDTTIDYLFEVEMSKKHYSGWTAIQLIDLKEPCLYNRSLEKNTVIYRFTWLRSFHNPISIRLEKNEKSAKLYWKIGKGAGGYEPKGIKTGGKRYLSVEEFDKFMFFFNNTNFHNLPNETYMLMCDGASWTFEYKTKDCFKAHRTNIPEANKTFKECCLFLLELTNIKVKEREIY